MTPQEAREAVETWPDGLPKGTGYRALETIANMHTETDYRVVPFDQVNGRYETRQRTRHVTDWKEHP